MSAIFAIGAPAPSSAPLITELTGRNVDLAATSSHTSFAKILTDGMRHADEKVAAANDLVRQFALDDSVPLHKVTYALEEARLSVELALQMRARLIEGYRDLMNMQL